MLDSGMNHRGESARREDCRRSSRARAFWRASRWLTCAGRSSGRPRNRNESISSPARRFPPDSGTRGERRPGGLECTKHRWLSDNSSEGPRDGYALAGRESHRTLDSSLPSAPVMRHRRSPPALGRHELSGDDGCGGARGLCRQCGTTCLVFRTRLPDLDHDELIDGSARANRHTSPAFPAGPRGRSYTVQTPTTRSSRATGGSQSRSRGLAGDQRDRAASW